MRSSTPGPAVARAVDGGPADAVQHDDRVRRTLRHGRPGRRHAGLARGRVARRTGWQLATDADAAFDREADDRCRSASTPVVTWGTNPEDALADRPAACPIPQRPRCPGPRRARAGRARLHGAADRARRWTRVAVDRVFIGSLHQRPDRGPEASGRGDLGRIAGRSSPASSSARQHGGQGAGGAGGHRPDRAGEPGLEWGDAGCSMCVGHERRRGRARASDARARPTATSADGRARAQAHAPDEPGDGRGGGGHGAVVRRARSTARNLLTATMMARRNTFRHWEPPVGGEGVRESRSSVPHLRPWIASPTPSQRRRTGVVSALGDRRQ